MPSDESGYIPHEQQARQRGRLHDRSRLHHHLSRSGDAGERLEQVDEDLSYHAKELDKRVVAKDQIRTIVRAVRDNLPAMLPDRDVDEHGRLQHIPKTLIFAKDDSHAEDILRIVREEFGKGNDVIAKITYRSSDGRKPEDLLSEFRARIDGRIGPDERARLEETAGQSLSAVGHDLVDAIDPDRHLAEAQKATGQPEPGDDAIATFRAYLDEHQDETSSRPPSGGSSRPTSRSGSAEPGIDQSRHAEAAAGPGRTDRGTARHREGAHSRGRFAGAARG